MTPLIKELIEGDKLYIQAIIVSASKGINSSGNQYWNIEIRDSSGSINAKKWIVEPRDEEIFVSGNIVQLRIEMNKFRDNLQAIITEAKKISEDEIDITRFVVAPPVPKEELIKRFDNLVSSIKNPDCKTLLDYFINKYAKKLYIAPAATSVHHEFSSGLLMHSVFMAENCDFICKQYGDIDRDLLITGALLHDFGKMVELEGPAIYKYSVEGKLLGHISIMCSELRKAAEELNITSEVPMLLEHMILSHHGKLEFGSPVLPLTKEALILSIVDLLDSKIMIVSKALDTVKPGEFTQKIFHIDNSMFYKPKK